MKIPVAIQNKSKYFLSAGFLLTFAGNIMREHNNIQWINITGKTFAVLSLLLMAIGAFVSGKVKPAFIIVMLATAIIFLIIPYFFSV